MIEKVKVIFEEINWTKILHYLFLFTLFFYLNFSLINFYLLKGQGDNLSDQFHILKTFCITAYILSVLGIAVYLSSYFKREFFIEIASGYVIYLFISYFLKKIYRKFFCYMHRAIDTFRLFRLIRDKFCLNLF